MFQPLAELGFCNTCTYDKLVPSNKFFDESGFAGDNREAACGG
jgi:hypothetical protein